ncbi:MAG: IS1595 family transposase, partial [Acidobacteria bacterium]|nr:IS1595 family transposase [Acidobacteriota bacterium]
MATENSTPDTLLGAITYFADVDVATAFVAALRWPDGVACPHCDGKNCPYVASRRIWQCKDCRKQFSVKVGSIFEDSPIALSKWLPAMWMLVNCKNGVSSYEIARDLGVTQKTAWFMLHRLRLAIHAKSFDKMGGTVEVDETFIGGKARNMHAAKRKRLGISQSRSMIGKVAVMGLLERHGDGSRVRMEVVSNRRRHQMEQTVGENVEAGSTVCTDALRSYDRMGSRGYVHQVIDHAEAYVDGSVHTNGLENFWSLLK